MPRRGPFAPSAQRDIPGFTLVEIVVVLVVLGLGAALVAPALLPPRQEEPTSLGAVIARVQDVAARRGETLLLDVSPAGTWAAFGTASREEEALGAGALEGTVPLRAFTLRVDPLGSCGLTLEADTAGWRPPVDPLTCRLASP
ncbi:MAG: prepilin-type N-terminal cleavage/methylation domain-containing protein [Gemmatimonadota bacterium]